jgi:hypothetical protein
MMDKRDEFSRANIKRIFRYWDLILALCVCGMFATQIIDTIYEGFPYWSWCCMCCWPIVIPVSLLSLCIQAFRHRGQRLIRICLVFLICIFITDYQTGGQYRWFELSMRIKLHEFGGAESLQTWVQNFLSSPEKLAYLQEHEFDGKRNLPPRMESFASNFTYVYYQPDSRGPSLAFELGARDDHWGITVGGSDLNPSFPSLVSKPWVKKIHPGVFLYQWSD